MASTMLSHWEGRHYIVYPDISLRKILRANRGFRGQPWLVSGERSGYLEPPQAQPDRELM